MFERFTDRARRAVVIAQESARELNHNYIGTEHLLLGLLQEADGVAGRILIRAGMTVEGVRQQILERIGRGATPPAGHIPFTPRAKTSMELGLRAALSLGHNYIGTEHLLVGLAAEGEGVAAHLLTESGLDEDTVRSAVVQVLSGSGTGTAGAGGWVGSAAARGTSLGLHTPATAAVIAWARGVAGDGPIGTHHLLAAMLADDDSLAARLLVEGRFDASAIDPPIVERATSGTSDETAEEAGARRTAVRAEGGKVVVEIDDEGLTAEVREILARLGGEGPPILISSDPAAGGKLADIWAAVQRSLTELRRELPSEGSDTSTDDEPEPGGA